MSDETTGCAFFVIIGIVGMVFIAPLCSDGTSTTSSSGELSKKRKAEKIIKSQLNYPSSYSLQGWTVDGNRVILEYKAKNAFGMEQTRRDVVYVD